MPSNNVPNVQYIQNEPILNNFYDVYEINNRRLGSNKTVFRDNFNSMFWTNNSKIVQGNIDFNLTNKSVKNPFTTNWINTQKKEYFNQKLNDNINFSPNMKDPISLELPENPVILVLLRPVNRNGKINTELFVPKQLYNFTSMQRILESPMGRIDPIRKLPIYRIMKPPTDVGKLWKSAEKWKETKARQVIEKVVKRKLGRDKARKLRENKTQLQ